MLLVPIFYWRGDGDYFPVYLLQNYTAQRMAVNQNNNTAAALAFSGTLLGYVIPLSSAAINAVSIPDYFAWGGIALVIQLLVFAGVRLYMPALSEKLLITIPQPECLWEPPRWLAVFLTQLV